MSDDLRARIEARCAAVSELFVFGPSDVEETVSRYRRDVATAYGVSIDRVSVEYVGGQLTAEIAPEGPKSQAFRRP